mmetsp:Transcript_12868/g.36622  ORF Transcript_12868/g.36622 Transcript_12868/m.36622 type:complete len:469 (-) Transcript_12868:72-1478(-)
MARWCLGHAVAAAVAGIAVSLSVSNPDKAEHHRRKTTTTTTTQFLPYHSAICPAVHAEKLFADGVEDSECDELIPQYNMRWWLREKGRVLPDHPAIFFKTSTHETVNTTLGFLKEFGSEELFALPEYAQRNGHLKNHQAMGAVNITISALPKSKSYLYASDSRCYDGSLCHRLARSYQVPPLFSADHMRKHLHIGGPGTGMPFHKHGHMWQGLATGRKAWYILPPGSMSENMHDLTGPYVFPVRVFHAMLRNRTLGKRPLYCVQKPGMVMYIPDYWWHATMNMDRLQVALGSKGMNLEEQKDTETKAKILEVFPRRKFDSAGWSLTSSGPLKKSWPMPYALSARATQIRRDCGVGVVSKRYGFEEPLQRMLLLDGSHVMDCLHETAAYAHCALARALEEDVLDSEACQRQLTPHHLHILRSVAIRWLTQARALSPTLVQREAVVCKRMMVKPPREADKTELPPPAEEV